MARAIYLVLQSRERWWVDIEGKSFGPFATRDRAVLEAIDMARFMAHTGRETEVRVREESGTIKLEWTSSHDPQRPDAKPAG